MKVTCLCLTKNRRQWLPKAIECFLNQTYPERELLIVADGADVSDLVPSDDRIRLIHLAETQSVGQKRNFGCVRAHGGIVCHWDDDDWSGPERLARQVEALCRDGAPAVAGFHSMRFTDGARWWKYIGTRNYALGTSLCYRKEWWQMNQFPALQVGEDNAFVANAFARRQLLTEDAGELMYATIHPGNTSPRNRGSNWKLIA